MTTVAVIIVLLAVLLAAFILTWRRQVRRAYWRAACARVLKADTQFPVRNGYPAIAEKLRPDGPNGRWPDLCDDPPCSPEDRWVCLNHDGHDYVYVTHCDRCYATWERTDHERHAPRCGAISPTTGALCLREAAHRDPWHQGQWGGWQAGKHHRRGGHEVIVRSITDVPAKRRQS